MLVSVIIPVYNVMKTLERAVKSVLEQTYTELEIILVDDGSTDGSSRLCDQLAKEDERIRVIHKKNGGLSSARNAGIEVAKGEYLAFLDSDDYFTSNIMAKFVKANKEYSTDLFVFNVCRTSSKGQMKQHALNTLIQNPETGVRALFDYDGVNFYAWNKIYNKNLFSDIRFPEGKLYEDTMPAYYITKKSQTIRITDDIGIYYVQNENSIVAAAFNPQQYDNVSERIKLLSEIKKDFPFLEDKALERVLDGFLSTGYKIACAQYNAETAQYYKRLKQDMRTFKPDLKKYQIPFTKMMALTLLQLNLKVYRILYKVYLGK